MVPATGLFNFPFQQVNTSVIQGFQLSHQQQHLWALEREGISCEAQCAIRLDGELNTNVLHDALCLVVERCEVLRTTFQQLPAVKLPVQVVADFSAPEWRTLNLSEHDASQLDVMIEKLLQQEARASFDFETGPLVKSLLLGLAPRQHLLILTLPALIADTGTLNKLFDELSDCYAACLSGTVAGNYASALRAVSAWQRNYLKISMLKKEGNLAQTKPCDSLRTNTARHFRWTSQSGYRTGAIDSKSRCEARSRRETHVVTCVLAHVAVAINA